MDDGTYREVTYLNGIIHAGLFAYALLSRQPALAAAALMGLACNVMAIAHSETR